MQEMLQNIHDCHVHFGQFRNAYHSARSVQKAIHEIGIKRACVMPTGIYSKKEFFECLASLKSFPEEIYDSFLWLSPRILRWMPIENLSKLHKFKAIKIHLIAHPDWYYNQDKIHKIADFAGIVHIPLMFHTGDFWFCEPQIFEPFVKEHPQTIFIFAHARPINPTIEIMSKYPNVVVDTAFTPIEDVKTLIDNGFANRTLWGTDFPIFPNEKDFKTAYITRVNQFKEILKECDFQKVMWENYQRIF